MKPLRKIVIQKNVMKTKKQHTSHSITINRWLITFYAITCFSLAAMAQDVQINEANFPDENFRNWLLTNTTPLGTNTNQGGTNGFGADGVLTQAEINQISGLDVKNLGIKNLKGIEFFTNITYLRLSPGAGAQSNPNVIPNLDLSNNNLLRRLYCVNTGIVDITFPTDKTRLQQFYGADNKFVELDFSGMTALNINYQNFECNTLEKIDISGTNLQSITINSNKLKNNLKTFIARNCTNLTTVTSKGASKTDYNALETMILTDCTRISALDCSYNSLTELDVTGCTNLATLNCNVNLLTKLDFTTNKKLNQVQFSDNLITEVLFDDPTTYTNLGSIIANRGGQGVIDLLLSSTKFPRLDNIQINGGPYLRRDKSTNQDVEINDKPMDVDNINHIMDLYGTTIRKLLCRHENLNVLTFPAYRSMEQLELMRNRFLTLDLSKISGISDSNVNGQYSVEDLMVFDKDGDGICEEVGIYLPNARDTYDADINRFSSFDFSNVEYGATWYIKENNGKYYLIISDNPAHDLDLYEKKISYTYNTNSLTSLIRYMDVTVMCNTYIMYVNPNSITTKGGNTFYSGTICLQYESIVPQNMEAYVLTGVEDLEKIVIDEAGNSVTSDQLKTAKYAGPGEVLPANTPVYVKTANPGLYAFQKNYDREYQGWKFDETMPSSLSERQRTKLIYEETRINNTVPAAPAVNMLEGTISGATVGTHSYLTLGREKDTRLVGFWLFTENTIPAHRAYIDFNATSLPAYAKKGATLDLVTKLINANRR